MARSQNTRSSLTLKEALLILKIPNLDGISENDLKSIRKQAYLRWHPDRLSGANVSQRERDLYEQNSKRIPKALETVRQHVRGKFHRYVRREYGVRNYTSDRTERQPGEAGELARRNATRMQEWLHGARAAASDLPKAPTGGLGRVRQRSASHLSAIACQI